MKRKIKVLSEEISNKIAAGEVVERPASVVKELVENSIDAGSKYITIEIKNGGISYLRVTDDGIGISREDASIAFERHATSKITTSDDLDNIITLGFRGEALASIAAVSHVELITRNMDESTGSNIVINGGRMVDEMEAGCPVGTTITVKNLFYNTPARMKFLKKDATEAGYVNDIVNRLIFAHPEISFKYINNGKEIVYTPGDNNLLNCVYSVYGKDYARNMIDTEYEDEGIKVEGLIGNSTVSRGNRNFQNFFINGRYVKSNMFSYALSEGYKNSIMINKFPVAVLHIKINPSLIDVNVHPTKQEVKFSNEKTVFKVIYWAVKNSLEKNKNIPQITFKKDDFKYSKDPIYHSENIKMQEVKPVSNVVNDKVKPIYTENQEKPVIEDKQKTFEISNTIKKREVNITDYVKEEKADIKDYSIKGQLFSTYILIEKNQDLLLLDQHAAHERLNYEELLRKYKSGNIYPQRLLSPAVILLSPIEIEIFNSNNEVLKKVGFEAEEFGNNSIIVRQTPVILQEEALKSIIGEILHILEKGQKDIITDIEYKILYSIACKSSVKGNQKLTEIEMNKLVEDCFKLENINTCPHGRPLMISVSKYKIEKEFKRVGL